jgi:hypothetical protein
MYFFEKKDTQKISDKRFFGGNLKLELVEDPGGLRGGLPPD